MLAETAGERPNDRLLAVARKPGRRFVVRSDAPSRLARLLWRVRLRLKALAPHWAPVRKLLRPPR